MLTRKTLGARRASPIFIEISFAALGFFAHGIELTSARNRNPSGVTLLALLTLVRTVDKFSWLALFEWHARAVACSVASAFLSWLYYRIRVAACARFTVVQMHVVEIVLRASSLIAYFTRKSWFAPTFSIPSFHFHT